jgi:hypothetical protein
MNRILKAGCLAIYALAALGLAVAAGATAYLGRRMP